MHGRSSPHNVRLWMVVGFLLSSEVLVHGDELAPARSSPSALAPLPAPRGTPTEPLLPQAASFIGADFVPIDLNTTLRLAGVQNPDVLVAQSRVVESQALRQLAAAQFLPSINIGTNY